MTHIKLTGVTRPEDAAAAAALGVDSIACVFSARSPRYVTSTTAWAIRRTLPPSTRFVGVFVDTPAPIVQRLVDQCQLDAAQLFGHEPRADVDAITPYAFKAVTVRTAADLDAAVKAYGRRGRDPLWPTLAVHLVGDVRADWDLAAGVAARYPVLLASEALTERQIPGAMHAAAPWGLDLWESVEQSPGVLDHARLADAVAAIRAHDALGVRAAGGQRRR